MSRPVILLGAGGHARVLLDALQSENVNVLGYVGPEQCTDTQTAYLGTDDQLSKFSIDEVELVIAVGDISLRRSLFDCFKAKGFVFRQVIHSSAVVSSAASLAEGVQVMAGAVVQAGVCIGENAIINTRASVDHDCRIDRHAHVAVGAVLAGGVAVGEGVLVGAGSTIVPGVCLAKDSVVGAGAVVIRDVASGQTVVGVPARVR